MLFTQQKYSARSNCQNPINPRSSAIHRMCTICGCGTQRFHRDHRTSYTQRLSTLLAAALIVFAGFGMAGCSNATNPTNPTSTTNSEQSTQKEQIVSDSKDTTQQETANKEESENTTPTDSPEAAQVKNELKNIKVEGSDVSYTEQQLNNMTIERVDKTLYVEFIQDAESDPVGSLNQAGLSGYELLQTLQTEENPPTQLTWIERNADKSLAFAYTLNGQTRPAKPTGVVVVGSSDAYVLSDVVYRSVADFLPEAQQGSVINSKGELVQ